MHAAVALALLSLAAPPSAGSRVAPAKAAGAQPAKPSGAPPPATRPAGAPLSDAERDFCSSELEVLERRQKLFEAQDLSAAEIARKNESAIHDVADCRIRFKEQGNRDVELKADLAEAARRAGPDATPLERDKAWKEVRRERLASKSPASLSAEEKAELAEGIQEEMKATHQALDTAHQKSPEFLRVIHSAIACYQGERKDSLKQAIDSEENLVKLGSGDRTRLYSLRSELRSSEEILARNAEATRSLTGGLDRCTAPTVAVVAHCLGLEDRPEPACQSEEIEQYLRFVR
jgi:hypothetical protein